MAMEIRVDNFIIRPDNGSTYSLTKVLKNKETGEEYEGGTTYPSSLLSCLVRIREEYSRTDTNYTCVSLDRGIEAIEQLNTKFIQILEDYAVNMESSLKKGVDSSPKKIVAEDDDLLDLGEMDLDLDI